MKLFSTKSQENQQKLNLEQQQTKWEIATNPTETSACNTQPAHTHLEKQFDHPKIAKLQKGTFAKWFLEKEKHHNDTY